MSHYSPREPQTIRFEKNNFTQQSGKYQWAHQGLDLQIRFALYLESS